MSNEINRKVHEAIVCPTERELWLEYGWLEESGSRNMLWYNEGNADEFARWIRGLMEKLRVDKPSGRMYWLLRIGEAEFQIEALSKTLGVDYE